LVSFLYALLYAYAVPGRSFSRFDAGSGGRERAIFVRFS
jgi:hypothetical protein